jgi:hypothetical protein
MHLLQYNSRVERRIKLVLSPNTGIARRYLLPHGEAIEVSELVVEGNGQVLGRLHLVENHGLLVAVFGEEFVVTRRLDDGSKVARAHLEEALLYCLLAPAQHF